ncbi:MAG: DUF268 domain-containing protein [Deltaproteobacteria bacterium]|nr:DUF268 domain-containing protein [Deltaproteobacteria bacterium]
MRLLHLNKPLRLSASLRGLTFYLKDYLALERQLAGANSPFSIASFYPCVHERHEQSGGASGHYFHQDLLVASRIFDHGPEKHVDVGSRIDGFVAHVASFRPIEVLDIRDLPRDIRNIRFTQADIMSENFNLKDYCDSLSSLHVIEHLGLGRYGDRVDHEGHLRGLRQMHGMLQRGGKFYCSAPIGEQRIEFNAHRVFSVPYLRDLFEKDYRIDFFSYVDDSGKLIENASLSDGAAKANFHCRYGCGIFEMTKR